MKWLGLEKVVEALARRGGNGMDGGGFMYVPWLCGLAVSISSALVGLSCGIFGVGSSRARRAGKKNGEFDNCILALKVELEVSSEWD